MCRVIVLVISLALAEGCRVPCHWHDPQPLVARFNEIATKLKALEQTLINHCRANNVPNDVKYYHNENELEIVIPLPGFEENDISVKAGRRLLFIEASSCQESLKFSDIRLIPDYLALNRGRWSYDGDELTISIPYSSGSLNRKNYLSFNNRNLQNGLIALRRDRCCSTSGRRYRRHLNSSTHDVENNV